MGDVSQGINCKFSFTEDQKKVIWEITNTCNYACDYCIFASNGRVNPHELTFEEVKNTIHQLKSHGFNYIKFTGGEPFIRQDMLDILSTCEALEIKYDISTNASLLSEGIIAKLNEMHYLSFLHISVDGFDKMSHEAVRGLKTWAPTLKGLNLLNACSVRKRVGCVLHTENYLQISSIVEFLISQNIDVVAFSVMEAAGRMAFSDKRILTTDQLNKAIYFIEKAQKDYSSIQIVSNLISQEYKTPNCQGGESFLFIDNIGTVSPCTWASKKDNSYLTQSLKKQTLSEILESPLFKSFKSVAKVAKSCPAQNSEADLIEHKFKKLYSFSNENLTQLPHLEKESVVATAGSSIDQALTFLLRGASCVEIVDINPKTQFYLNFKITAILTFSYDEFLDFFTTDMSYHQYKKLRLNLDASTQKYWDTEYLLNDYKSLLNTDVFNKESQSLNKSFIPYLEKNSYEFLKTLDLGAQIKFTHTDLVKERTLSRKVDLLYLSNIPDYSHKFFKSGHYINDLYELFEDYLKVSKKIVFYIYDIDNLNNSDKRNVLNDSSVRGSMAKQIACSIEEITFTSIFNNKQRDALCTIMKKD